MFVLFHLKEIVLSTQILIYRYKGDIMDFKLFTKKATSKKLSQHMNG